MNSQPERAGGDESSGTHERPGSGAGRLLLALSPGLDKLESFLVSEDLVFNNSPRLLAKTYPVPPLLVPRFSAARRPDKCCAMMISEALAALAQSKSSLPNPGILDVLQHLFWAVVPLHLSGLLTLVLILESQEAI